MVVAVLVDLVDLVVAELFAFDQDQAVVVVVVVHYSGLDVAAQDSKVHSAEVEQSDFVARCGRQVHGFGFAAVALVVVDVDAVVVVAAVAVVAVGIVEDVVGEVSQGVVEVVMLPVDGCVEDEDEWPSMVESIAVPLAFEAKEVVH